MIGFVKDFVTGFMIGFMKDYMTGFKIRFMTRFKTGFMEGFMAVFMTVIGTLSRNQNFQKSDFPHVLTILSSISITYLIIH